MVAWWPCSQRISICLDHFQRQGQQIGMILVYLKLGHPKIPWSITIRNHIPSKKSCHFESCWGLPVCPMFRQTPSGQIEVTCYFRRPVLADTKWSGAQWGDVGCRVFCTGPVQLHAGCLIDVYWVSNSSYMGSSLCHNMWMDEFIPLKQPVLAGLANRFWPLLKRKTLNDSRWSERAFEVAGCIRERTM